MRRAAFKSKGSLALLEVPVLTLVCLVDLASVIAFRVCSALDFPCAPCQFNEQVALRSAFRFHATTKNPYNKPDSGRSFHCLSFTVWGPPMLVSACCPEVYAIHTGSP